MAALASPARKLLKLSPLPPRSASLVAKGQRTMLQDTPLSNSRPMTRSSCKPRSPDWKRSFDANRQRLLRSTRPRVQYAHPSHPADARPPRGAARYPNGHDLSTQAMCAVGPVPGPSVVGLATPDTTLSVLQPVVVHLALGEAVTLREAIDMTPLDLGPDQDMILG